MNPLIAQLLRDLVYAALGAGVEKVVGGLRAPEVGLGDLQVAGMGHPRACGCEDCDDRFILGLDDDD